MDKVRSGLSTYLSTKEFTQDFMDDVDMMISKTYISWSLYEDEEEFRSSCWTKIVSALEIFDASVGLLSTYLYQVIWNEAQRIHSKHKRMTYDDLDELPKFNKVWAVERSEDEDLELRSRVCSFARSAYAMGVYVRQESVYRNYILGNLTPAVKAFMWTSILGGDFIAN